MKIFLNHNVSFLTKPYDLKQAHNFFRDAIVLHTISLVVKGIEKNPELIEYIKKNNIDVQVSCWQPYNDNTQKCFDEVERIFGERPDKVYKYEETRVGLNHYCIKEGYVTDSIIAFNCSNYNDLILLEPALEIYNRIRYKYETSDNWIR